MSLGPLAFIEVAVMTALLPLLLLFGADDRG